MENRNLYLLLEIINHNGDARRLVMEGLDYKSIGDLTTSALQEEYIYFDNNKKLKLSPKGIEKYNTDKKKFKKTNKDEWILPDLKSKVSKIDKNDIFLPRQNELTF